MPKNVLVVEDNPELSGKIVKSALKAGFGRADIAGSKRKAIEIWDAAPHVFDVVVLDINLDDMGGAQNRDGWDVLRYFRRSRQDFIVLISTGALDSQDAQMLSAVIAQPIMLFKKGSDDVQFFDKIAELGKTYAGDAGPAFFTHDENKDLDALATSNTPVLLIGPPGSGKSVKARELAVRSKCHEERIVSINCAGLSAELAEGILFGYMQGTYTDAKRNTIGLLMRASGFPEGSLAKTPAGVTKAKSPKNYSAFRAKEPIWGAVILDEIGALDYRVQGKLLSVLEGEPIVPLGWTEAGFLPNFRVIAATNELEVLRNRKQFRPDLLRRLTTWVLKCRASSEEPDDKIEELIGRTLIERRIDGVAGLEAPAIEPAALHWLVGQKGKLTGGLRELHWIVHRGWLISRRRQGHSIMIEDMKEAWKISGEIYSVLALNEESQSADKPYPPAKVATIRQELAAAVGLEPDALDHKSFGKEVRRHANRKNLRTVLDGIVRGDWDLLELALRFESKDMAGWYRTQFSRKKNNN